MSDAVVLIERLITTAREFYQRGWMWGTSGNLSVRLSTEPEVIAITGSGASKGSLRHEDIVVLPDAQRAIMGLAPAKAMPSTETAIHQAVYRTVPEAWAVLHVHTEASTLLMTPIPNLIPGRGKEGGERPEIRFIEVASLEMLKGWGIGWKQGQLHASIPVLPNRESMEELAQAFSRLLAKTPQVPLVLVEGHGLTVWGGTIDEARNRLEVAEFICQVMWGRRQAGL